MCPSWCGAGLWCVVSRTTILAENPATLRSCGVDEALLKERLQEATTKHMRRNELNRGSDAEQLAADAYRTIDEAHPLLPFVGANGKQMDVDELAMHLVMDGVRANYNEALDRMHGTKPQEVIAEQVGVTARTLQGWRHGNGIFKVDAETCTRLCDALGISVDELRGTAEVGRGLSTAYSPRAFRERYARLSYDHRVMLSRLLKDFLDAEAMESLCLDTLEAVEVATTKDAQAKV